MNAFSSFYDYFEGWAAFLITSVVSLLLGLALALTYRHIKKGYVYTKYMPLAILLIPISMSILIGLLNLRNSEIESSTAIRVGIVLTSGIALTRFRSDKLAIEDMLYLVFASVFGIVSGLGYVAYSLISAVLVISVLLVLHAFKFGEDMGGILSVRIKVPEELNDQSVFDSALAKHCSSYNLTQVRTVEYGQLYEIRYDVKLSKDESVKNLIDEIRTHNGNLEVVVSAAEKR